jgi:uncharacterized membrane protein YphA (DoxX/SURF4 family)
MPAGFLNPPDTHPQGRNSLENRGQIIAATTLRWLLGGSFLWAGTIKLSNPRAFAQSIDAFNLVPETLLPPLAILLPLVEVFIGLAVLRRWRGGLPAMTALLFLFLGVLAFAIGQNLDVDCGCFSVAEQQEHTSVKAAFVRDLLMLAGVAALGLLTRRPDSSNQGRPSLFQESKENG